MGLHFGRKQYFFKICPTNSRGFSGDISCFFIITRDYFGCNSCFFVICPRFSSYYSVVICLFKVFARLFIGPNHNYYISDRYSPKFIRHIWIIFKIPPDTPQIYFIYFSAKTAFRNSHTLAIELILIFSSGVCTSHMFGPSEIQSNPSIFPERIPHSSPA